MSALKQRITQDMKTAMRAKDKARLGVIRMALAAIKQREIDERAKLDDAGLDDTQIIVIIDKMIKQRRDSASQFQNAGRDELAAIENAEINVLQDYMPAAMSDDEITKVIDKAIADTGASSIKDMGKLMAALKPQLQGRADLGAVSGTIKQKLAAL
ncbi:GatB/YqeY domain-containing protein [Gammaproteobacteria bacterium AH-315-M22]|nr:GatB/YqeY domain-containing protein [Gammaproteobacteria bacterium AH-315-M22]